MNTISTNEFLAAWSESAMTTLGFFWMALWAFILGYALSSVIQVFATRERMKNAMGDESFKSILLGTTFGFLSSSCSFSALATTKALFQKGASFIASIAFLLASTNLVIELGIVISIFLGWQFVVGEYVGGFLLILFSWILIKIIRPTQLIRNTRSKLDEAHNHDAPKDSLSERLSSIEPWKKVGQQYVMEWRMVWKDVTVGFTIAGVVAAFVPNAFFETLFIGSGASGAEVGFLTLLQHTLVGPFAAFLTFIGSMGNIPLAALLFGKGVSFAGVMAFIFSDLVVFPVLRINARYYGWKMSLFILGLLFASLIVSSLVLHYGFAFFDLLPTEAAASILEREHFKVDTTLFLNIGFLLVSGILIYLSARSKGHDHHPMASKGEMLERTLKWLSFGCYAWLLAGVGLHFFMH